MCVLTIGDKFGDFSKKDNEIQYISNIKQNQNWKSSNALMKSTKVSPKQIGLF